MLCLTFDKNDHQKVKREVRRIVVRNPGSTVMEKMKSTPPLFKCVILGLNCLIQKVEIVPTYLVEDGKLNQS